MGDDKMTNIRMFSLLSCSSFLFIWMYLLYKANIMLHKHHQSPSLRFLARNDHRKLSRYRNESTLPILNYGFKFSELKFALKEFQNKRILEKSIVLRILNASYAQHHKMPNVIKVKCEQYICQSRFL